MHHASEHDKDLKGDLEGFRIKNEGKERKEKKRRIMRFLMLSAFYL